MEILKDALFVNAYWFSLPFIGYAVLYCLSRWNRSSPSLRNLSQFALKQNILIVAFASFVTAMTILGIVSVLGYVLGLPLIVLSVVYIGMLLGSLALLASIIWRHLFKRTVIDPFGFREQTVLARLAFIGFCAFVVIDFVIALYARSHAALGSDTYVHLSRIVTILNEGFTIQSGFFGSVAEVGYHMNIIYSVYAVPAQLLHITPTTVWEYSYGFFRFMQWTALFSLAWYVWTYWLRVKDNALLYASLSGMLAVGYFSMAFFIAVYPNQIVGLWLIALIIALSQYDFGKRAAAIPAVMTAFLITFTHPTYAVMAGLFIGLVYVLKAWLLRREFMGVAFKRTTGLYALLLAVLSLAPLRSAFIPSHMTEAGVSILRYDTIDWGFLTMKQPDFVYVGKSGTLLILLGILGTFYLAYRLWKVKRQWALVVSLILFYPAMVYIPFTYTVLQAVFPVWLIDRFTAMNILNFVGVPLGVYGLISLIQTVARRRYADKKWLTGNHAATLVCAASILTIAVYYMQAAPGRVLQYKEQNDHYYSFMDRTYARFHTVLKDEKVLLAHNGDSYFLASIFPVDVIAIEETHTTPSADAKHRVACQDEMLRTMRYADLKATGVSYLVLSTYEKSFPVERVRAETRPYLRFIEGNGDFYIYKFLANKGGQDVNEEAYRACRTYQAIEKG